MISLSFTIVPSRANADGSHSIRLKISNAHTTRYIVTPYKVDRPAQLQNGVVVRHPMAAVYNQKLSAMLIDYTERAAAYSNKQATATEIRAYLESGSNLSLFEDYAKSFIKDLEDNGQTSYAQNMGYTMRQFVECFPNIGLQEITPAILHRWDTWLTKRGYSSTTINIRMTHIKALLNSAITNGVVEYKIFPFRGYKLPSKVVRDICISHNELHRLRDAEFDGVSARRLTVARDLFMLSFYCAGINLTDLIDAQVDGNTLTFIRKKTAAKKQCPNKEVSITIQPEARDIINKYITPAGVLDFGYNYTDYAQFRSFVTKSLNRIGEMLNFEKKLMYYSARKTFCQFGFELGVPLYVLEYAIGQTIKDAANRPIFNYIKIMRRQADDAIRKIINHSKDDDVEY